MILMNDFKKEPEKLIHSEIEAAERVIRSGWYVLGKEVSNFELLWAQKCGSLYSVGTANGMDAIEIGLRCLKLVEGDEVITTPMTAFATVLAIIKAGLTPVLADIDPGTGLLSVESAERCISSRTKALLLVHLYGQMAQMDRWLELTGNYRIALLEDCAQSHLARWEGKTAGCFGLWGAYSFYPTKNLGAIGDAGALITNSEMIAAQAKILRNYGQSERYHHPEIGLNSRLDELQAALLSVRSQWLESFNRRRVQIAETYLQGINNWRIKLLKPPETQESHMYHLFVILTDEREHLMQYLKEKGINTLIHYPIPIHHQAPCRGLKTDDQGLSNSEYHAEHCLSIPCHPQMSEEDTDYIIEVLNEYR
ncbi:MAG: dTDP-3-amino-3,6-dideoxy-alpha-D-galactopyranose transaminase [Chroococcopsis gigantea SAG 12.99]|jgi:dTDP-4-amino-4,6-dideoxygalactose transaminase|nr:dTDP-3-amino-3,6-dideoxy-alpha-D-galactopyranose transaminase [Chroococcopsis gigantea SAG 12.99]